MTFLLLILAYLLGSIPTGVILAKVFGNIDPRTQGSKNIGATNVFRTAGKKLGVITLLGDILKGLIPVAIARGTLDSYFWIGAVALAAFLGHLYPIFLKFKGGKGIATGLGVFLALSPLPAILSLLVFGAVVYRWRFISLGSLSATAAFLFLLALLNPHRIYIPFALIIGVLIFYRHRENIERLLGGKESKVGVKSSPTEPS
ncbi:MAG: glycerol-3-phosphate 1-O-acyltransferase PlsY [Thermodesulfobacteriota bacterium]|jgi:glycerol-3-phosphate acyltransferase PlsY